MSLSRVSGSLTATVAFACAFAPGAARALPLVDAGDAAAAARIDTQCAESVDRVIKDRPHEFVRMYGREERGQWRESTPAIVHRIAVDPDIASEIARVWQLAARVVLVNIEYRSLEQQSNSTYCFRGSGTLARVMESTAGAVVRDEESRYLDERGHVIATHSKFYPLYYDRGGKLSPDLRPSTPSLYLTVQRLPFYAMLAPVRP